MAVYYAGGIAFSAVEARAVSGGGSFAAAVGRLEPWSALVLVPAACAVLAGFAGFLHAAWRGTALERAQGRRALAALPAAYSGRIPARVRRRSPAALAGYELPMGLLGFPGVGWLFAGFPLPATVLLLGGPAFAWAILPIAFSPYGQGPLRGVGWKVELVYLPISALLSAAALYRSHRRRRLRLLGPQTPGAQPRRLGRYRLRVGVTVGAIALVLISVPFVGAVTGSGGGAVRYTLQPRLTPEITGQFLTTARGPVKLFSWPDPQARYPADPLRVHASDVQALLVRAAALDAPSAYALFDLDRNLRVPLRLLSHGARSLSLAPERRLVPGRYVFTATHEGMFGGRDYAYLTVVAPSAPVSALSPAGRRTPAVAHALAPVAAALVAALFSILLVRSYRRRPAGQKALWATGFLLFAAAAACEALAQRHGWTSWLFRGYYLCGGVLTVGALGAGSAWLQLPRRGRDVLLGMLVVAAAAATASVLLAPVDVAALTATSSTRPPVNGALGGHAYLWAIGLNSLGTLFLVGGSLLSIVRRRNVRANVWIGLGAIVVALATGLSRGGDYTFVYLGQLVGVALMFVGFTLPPPAPRQTPVAGTAFRPAAR
jgi:hypothetical protein